jgi:ABC-type glycerol-3-phosphate transport system substrate-binding protein
MKNLFKFGFLALAITLSAAACQSNTSESGTADSIDSTADVTTDSLADVADTVDSAAEVSIDSATKN